MDLVLRIALRLGKWLLGQVLNGGHASGGTLPKMNLPSVPPPSNTAAKAKAKALAVENTVLRQDAAADHAGRAEELRKEAEVTDADGRVTGLSFGRKP